MNIKGLDYNTQRQPLLMPEYGREIHKMVEVAIALPTKVRRQQCANTIVKQMENKVPQIRQNANYKQTLWDHLFLMSQQRLDIDWPYDVSQAEKILAKPQPMKLPPKGIGLRHYGRLIEELTQRLKRMPAGAERNELARLTANQMKRDLMQWGHGSIDDEKVADDLARMTEGVIQLDLKHFNFERNQARGNNTPQTKRNKKKR